MKVGKILVLGIAGMTLCGQAVGESEFDQTGSNLLRWCQGAIRVVEGNANAEDRRLSTYCLLAQENAWMGANIGSLMYQDNQNKTTADNVICPPTGSTREQNVRIIVKYLLAHPAILHYHPSLLVTMALREAYPCE